MAPEALWGWRLARRHDVTPLTGAASRAIATALALAAGGLFVQAAGLPALALGQRALQSTLGSAFGLQQAGVLATPLILTGLAVALGLRMRLWNIGAEGQLFIGAWAAAGAALHWFGDGPAAVMLPALFAVGALAGAAWILIPALARAYLNVNEIVTTLLLNFVAVQVVNHFAIGPWRDRSVGVLTATERIPYELPLLSGSLHAGILIALALAAALAVLLQRTTWGYEISTIGGNARAAAYAGMPVKRHMLTILLISGAIAGMAGVIEITGTAHRLSGTISNKYGFLGIIVATLANASPAAVVPMGFFLAVLLNAGIVLQAQGLSVNAVLGLTGVILLFVAIGEVAARYQLVKREAPALLKRKQPAEAQADP